MQCLLLPESSDMSSAIPANGPRPSRWVWEQLGET